MIYGMGVYCKAVRAEAIGFSTLGLLFLWRQEIT
jgi:hypothetical protein